MIGYGFSPQNPPVGIGPSSHGLRFQGFQMEAGRHFRSDDALDVFLESHAPQRLGLFIPQRNKGHFSGRKKRERAASHE